MDPASIVGVAAAAIQFLSFATSVMTGGWRAISSSRDLPIQATDLEAASARFKEMIQHLTRQLEALESKGAQLSEMELLLQGVCADCRSKAHELHDAISALAQNLGREKRMQSLWQALKGELGLGRVEYLADTLSKHQRALFSVTISCLWSVVVPAV